MNESFLLSWLIFAPVLGVVALFFIPKQDQQTIKLVGFLATVPSLLISLFIFYDYVNDGDLNAYSQFYSWINFGTFQGLSEKMFTVPYELGIDGFALIMIVLTTVLATLAAIASIHIKQEWKGYFQLFLILEIGMLGVFAAQNLILFFIFFEITLIPMFFLIGKWGYFAKEKAAYSYLIYNGIGSAVLLLAILILFSRTGTANIGELHKLFTAPDLKPIADNMISETARYGILGLFLIAFGVKLPIVPLHSWMLKVHVEAPPSIVMLHSGVLLKIGAFGLIRFGIGIFPEQFKDIGWILAILGVVNLLYGAFLAFIQKDFKMVLAYSSISHMGIVLIGLGALNTAGVEGAIFQVVSHGLISALMFFLVGVMYERVHTTMIDKLGGLAKAMPILSGFFLAGAMASLGLPGMSGFVSEFMAFLGLFDVQPITAAVGTIGIIMTAAYLLRAVLNITFGSNREYSVVDIRGVEMVPVIVLLALIIVIGVLPATLSVPLEQTVTNIVSAIGGGS